MDMLSLGVRDCCHGCLGEGDQELYSLNRTRIMLVIFWLQCSDAAIKWLALIQGLYMNLVYIQSAHNKGAWLAYCTVYVLLMLVMNSRLKMQTVLPEWLFNVH